MSFDKNQKLDELIIQINDLLEPAEKKMLNSNAAQKNIFPTVFLLGTPRSGSTLFMQWAASTGAFGYPTNFISRFNRAPYVAALIHKMVTDDDYQYMNEFSDISKNQKFSSSIGKTEGFTAPHEFWYFWRRFMEFREIPCEEKYFEKNFDFRTFQLELNLLKNAFEKPFIMKGQILNWYLETVSNKLENSIFIHLYRDPVSVCRSLLRAREIWYGSQNVWFSAKPREYPWLAEMDAYHQVAGQVYFINKEIFAKRDNLGSAYFMVDYSDFCSDPELVYNQLKNKISDFNQDLVLPEYTGIERFEESDPQTSKDEKINDAYSYFEEKYGIINLS